MQPATVTVGMYVVLRRFMFVWVRSKGASIYDVRTEGGRGVPSKADIVSNFSKGGCVNLRTRGEGVKKSEIFADVMNGCSLGAAADPSRS